MKKYCVIFGGLSAEHDISIITGMQLAKNIGAKFNVEKIYLGLDNKFYLASKLTELSEFKDKSKLQLPEVFFCDGALYKASRLITKKLFDIECIINCCHGGVGENGDLAAFFNINNIRYTSSNPLASHIAMNKDLAKKCIGNIVPTIKGIKVTKSNYDDAIKKIADDFASELIVKPNSLGSSIGVKACNKGDFIDQIQAIFELNDDALVEERVCDIAEYNQACFFDGDELNLSVIEQPITKSTFLTFDEKYKTNSKSKGSDRIIPAKISKHLTQLINTYTAKIYTVLNLNGVVRIDYIYDKASKKLYFNEVNTIPGSMAFYLYEPKGIDYITLIEKLITNGTTPQRFTYIDTEILNNKKL